MPTTTRAVALTAWLSVLAISDPGRAETSSCGDGQVMTAGHCCWPAQVWGDETARCRGTPSCPSGLKVSGETCIVECEEPRRLSLGHCCFPGQEWSNALGRCVGAASCPSDWTPSEDGCVRVCTDGRAAVDGVHCCWPGQTFVGDGCRGAPACAPPYRRDGDVCIGPEELAKRAEAEAKVAATKRAQDRVALLGEGSFSLLAFTYFNVGTRAGPRARFTDWHAHLHLPAVPIELHAGLGAGSFLADNGGKTDLTHWTLGAAIAPFSFPNAATHSFSLFNPSMGVAVHRLTPKFSSTFETNTSLLAEFGNSIILQAREKGSTVGYGATLRFGYLQNLSGDSPSAPISGFYVGLMIGPTFDAL